MYVLDTNTLVYFFKGVGKVAERFLATSPQDIAIPSIVLYELEVGIAKSVSPSKRRKQLNELLFSLSRKKRPLPARQSASVWRRKERRSGRSMS